jgi:hypothetical protein
MPGQLRGGACTLLVKAAGFIVWSKDRRRDRPQPDPDTDRAADDLSPLQFGGRGKG